MRVVRAPGDRPRRLRRPLLRRVHEMLWAVVVALAATLGAVTTLVLHGWPSLVVQLSTMTLTGAAFGACLTEDPRQRWTRAPRWGRAAAMTGLVAVGLGELVGAASVLLVPALWVLHPGVVGWLWRQLHRRRTAGARRPEEIRGLSDSELRRQWHRTGAAIRSGWAGPQEIDRLADVRRGLLDEMERRDPSAFARRIAEGSGR